MHMLVACRCAADLGLAHTFLDCTVDSCGGAVAALQYARGKCEICACVVGTWAFQLPHRAQKGVANAEADAEWFHANMRHASIAAQANQPCQRASTFISLQCSCWLSLISCVLAVLQHTLAAKSSPSPLSAVSLAGQPTEQDPAAPPALPAVFSCKETLCCMPSGYIGWRLWLLQLAISLQGC